MENKKALLVLAILFCYMSVQVHSKYHTENKHGFKYKEKVTNLHFYLFDIHSGKNPTAIEISRPNKTAGAKLATHPFGHLFAIDDPLREGPHENSTVIGNARGLYLLSSQGEDITLLMAVDFAFITGEFNGSSFSVLSRNPVTETRRELALVGGRGKFRLARGFAKLRTHYLNTQNVELERWVLEIPSYVEKDPNVGIQAHEIRAVNFPTLGKSPRVPLRMGIRMREFFLVGTGLGGKFPPRRPRRLEREIPVLESPKNVHYLTRG
ncbi:hypothetical protein PIB30_001324 [Stylosanthes scabra]|uniref:Dirigent protein n=1 Tax=Stylosanthes scabra TaxID=79078 RepID=A0ABU6Y154_9FABA|nr:hypothetical protein [Stylosanthes scabra]